MRKKGGRKEREEEEEGRKEGEEEEKGLSRDNTRMRKERKGEASELSLGTRMGRRRQGRGGMRQRRCICGEHSFTLS